MGVLGGTQGTTPPFSISPPCDMFSPSLNFLDLPMNYVVWQFILQLFIL